MKKLISFLFLATIITGCKKSSDASDASEGYYTITGVVRDWDAKNTIAGAKVYVRAAGLFTDSAMSDANGKVSFTYKKEGNFKSLYAVKDNYLVPPLYYLSVHNYESRTDSVYLVKPSFANITVHKTNTYLPFDSIAIQVQGDYQLPVGHYNNYRVMMRDKADAADKLFNLQAVYGSSQGAIYIGSFKLYFQWDIIRNGSVISSQADSTALIQFGTKNFTLNY